MARAGFENKNSAGFEGVEGEVWGQVHRENAKYKLLGVASIQGVE